MLTSEKYEDTVGPHIKNYLDQDFPPEQPLFMMIWNTMIIHNHENQPQRRKGNNLQDL